MVLKEDLINELNEVLAAKKYPEDQVALINEAYRFADKQHKGQLRSSGEEYITHPLSVAIYLARMNVDKEMIITGLLHDVVEDTGFTMQDLENKYGKKIALLVDGVTKITKLKSASKSDIKAETIRKMLFTMILDLRVIIIKLADKIHNMSTLEHLPPEKRKRIATETLEIYSPLAGKLGLNIIKNRLENLAFKALEPNVYDEIEEFINSNKNHRIDMIHLISKKLKNKLEKNNIKFKIKSRVKHYYSIYTKMKKFNKKIENIFDLYGLRIITDNIENCYLIFGIIHSIWKPVHGRFKDYIANPKSNGYKSLHTTVILGKRKFIEIQIRTKKMDEMNEFGIAAHWYYKKGNTPVDNNMKWLNSLKKVQEQKLSPQAYYQTIRSDILKDEIYIFTPKNDIFEMPKGSTPLDFAYRIHTEVGHRCKGAKANGNIIPLSSELKNGMVVDIITSKEPCPKRSWISICKTIQAKRKIRHYFRANDDHGVVHEPPKKEHPEKLKKAKDRPHSQPAKKNQNKNIGILVEGEKNMLFNFAKCCNPKPKEPIIGFVTRSRGIMIHKFDCKNINSIKDFENRKLNVNWS